MKKIDKEKLKKRADEGDALAQYQWGCTFLEGINIDIDKAKYWFEQSARQECPEGINGLGFCYYNIDEFDAAFKCFKRVSDMGFPKGIWNLARCYYRGYGVEQDKNRAFELFRKSADLGYADAQSTMGMLYFRGILEKDYALAVYWFRKAVKNEKRDEYGNYGLGECYYYGYGVKQNYKKAFMYYSIAAEQDNVNAMLQLAECFRLGQGTEINYAKCFYWTWRANSERKAIIKIISYFKDGVGVWVSKKEVKFFSEALKLPADSWNEEGDDFDKKLDIQYHREPGRDKAQLIRALYFADYKKVEKLVSADDFDKTILIRDISTEEQPYPLFYIPIFVSKVAASMIKYYDLPEVRRDIFELLEMSERKIESSEMIMNLLSSKFGIKFNVEIPYHMYRSLFWPENMLYYKLGFEESVERGYCTKNDIELQHAAMDFEFKKVKELILNGANPDIELLGVSLLDTLSDLGCFMAQFSLNPVTKKTRNPQFGDLCMLMTWSAAETEIDLVEKYDRQRQKVKRTNA